MPRALRLAAPALAALLAAPAAAAAQSFVGPSPYLSFSASPFGGTPFAYFHLEDFEDGALDTPGALMAGGTILGPSPFTDSVDGDDGAIDGSGANGWSVLSQGSTSITFTFSAAALGALPTHAGIVWTDVGNAAVTGFAPVRFEVFGVGLPGGTASFGPFVLGDGAALGATAEDRFFGVEWAGGISAIRLTTEGSTDWELDHLHYGRVSAVPEPATLALAASGLAALGAAGALRRRRAAERR